MFSGREKRFLLPAETNAGELQPGRDCPVYRGGVWVLPPGRVGVPAPQPPPPPGLVPEPPGQVAETGTLRENAGGERCSGGCPPSAAPREGVPAPRAPSGTHVTHLHPLPPLGPCASLEKMQHRVSSKMLLNISAPPTPPAGTHLWGQVSGCAPHKDPQIHQCFLSPSLLQKRLSTLKSVKTIRDSAWRPNAAFSFSCGTISTGIHPPNQLN